MCAAWGLLSGGGKKFEFVTCRWEFVIFMWGNSPTCHKLNFFSKKNWVRDIWVRVRNIHVRQLAMCAAWGPPKNGLIAVWSATNRWYVVEYVSQKQNRSNNSTNGTIFESVLYLNSAKVYIRLNYVYSVISVKDKRLPGNTKKWTLVRSWLIRVRLVHSWAVVEGGRKKKIDFVTCRWECVIFMWRN